MLKLTYGECVSPESVLPWGVTSPYEGCMFSLAMKFLICLKKRGGGGGN